MNRILLSIVCLALLLMTPRAQNPDSKPAKWQIDDVVMTEAASQFDLSPDAKWVVWVKTTPDKDKDGRVSNLILSALSEKKEIELTRSTEHDSSNPKWSPNGQLIAFVSVRPVPKAKPAAPGEAPKRQLWLINPFGGEPWHLTNLERGITNYEWLDDDTILFSAPEDPTNYEATIKEKKDATIVVEDEEHAPPVRLFKFSVKAKKVTRLSSNNDWIQSFEIARDGARVLALHNRSLRYVYDQAVKPVVYLHDLKAGTSRQLFPDGKLLVQAINAAREADGFYLTTAYTTHPKYVNAAIRRVHYYDPATDKVAPVNLAWEHGLAGALEMTNDGFIALLANGARHKLARYVHEGAMWRKQELSGAHAGNTFGVKLGKNGKTLLYQFSNTGTPQQWYRAALDGAAVKDHAQLTDLNPHFKNRAKAKAEVIRWKGANDEEVEGILYYPHNYEAGNQYPLMLMIHGGPHGADFDQWHENWAYPTNLICERGAFVLKPNYHGSSNYGLKFGESIAGGKYYDLEVPDIEKGVDHLIAKGLVDANRLGTMGWSNGSILSIALTTFGANPRRYKVLGAGAGDVDWTSDWGNAHFGASFDNYYFGKSPLEDPQLYLQKSPFFKLNKVRVPTIIFFGTQDTNVPTQQGWMHYRALQQAGETPVRFILFPGEAHGLQKLSHQRRKLEEELAWFDKHFFRHYQPENEAFKQDSPLALAFKQAGFKKTGAFYGEFVNGKLIPETVKPGNLKFEIGRFEITRAQFAAFEPSSQLEPGTENHPVGGVTFEQAQAYCDWLGKLTGQPYRLAQTDEVAALYEAAKSGENTLDYWAGYRVNPDDAARLQMKLRQLPGAAPLLKTVGSFKGLGEEELVFDLGGNVAEWAIGKEGRGTALGGSADQPQDEKRVERKPAPAYIGFRVVKGDKP